LLRGAALAGGGAALYHAGKKHQARQEQEAPQDEQAQEDSQQQAAPAAPSSGLSEEAMTQLKELGKLHDQGVLTDQEFEAQKARILNA